MIGKLIAKFFNLTERRRAERLEHERRAMRFGLLKALHEADDWVDMLRLDDLLEAEGIPNYRHLYGELQRKKAAVKYDTLKDLANEGLIEKTLGTVRNTSKNGPPVFPIIFYRIKP